MKLLQADKEFMIRLEKHCQGSQVLESFIMGKKEIYRAERLVKLGLVIKDKFDGAGNINTYYPAKPLCTCGDNPGHTCYCTGGE
jgi:hypothetical protein